MFNEIDGFYGGRPFDGLFAAQKLPLSFTIGGTDARDMSRNEASTEKTEDGVEEKVFTREYRCGINARTTVKYYAQYGAYEWYTYFENTADTDSPLLENIKDCDISVPFDRDPAPSPRTGGQLPGPETACIFTSSGSNCTENEFRERRNYIRPTESRGFSAGGGGRSSQNYLPFFDVCKNDRGFIIAVGWTGEWYVSAERDEKYIRFTCGIADAAFYLKPGEGVRTASYVLLPYSEGRDKAHNDWRRLVKNRFSLIGTPGRPQFAPLCHVFWGSRHSDEIIDTVKKLKNFDLGYEYVWIDAGWYGDSVTECPSEFTGDWCAHTGDWFPNKLYHPDGMDKVAETIHDCGLGFLLWIEPERCVRWTIAVKEHPELFLQNGDNDSMLINYADPAAVDYNIETVDAIINRYSLQCYRQDFNIDPLPFWRAKDEEGRRGLTEIKYIAGLYRFLDTLLQRHPALIIDNCASGGRRLDIEMLRRTVSLWRSDYQCPWNAPPEAGQTHMSGVNMYLPYSGTGAGNITGDTYRFRSNYGTSIAMNCFGYVGWDFDPKAADWIRSANAEFKQVRPYFTEDYYRLIDSPADSTNWAAAQFDRPESGDGIVLTFRRPDSPFEDACLPVKGFDPKKTYVFTDKDSGAQSSYTGKELLKNGLPVTMEHKRMSRLIFYKAE